MFCSTSYRTCWKFFWAYKCYSDSLLAVRWRATDSTIGACLCYVYWSQWRIKSEVKFLQVSCLAIIESCKLFGIPEAELYLESCTIVFDDVFGRHFKIGGEIDFVSSWLCVMNHDFDVPFHCLWIGLDRVGPSSFHVEKLATLKVEFLKINLLAFDAWSSPFACADTVMWIPQSGIITQTADDMESQQTGFIDELCLWSDSAKVLNLKRCTSILSAIIRVPITSLCMKQDPAVFGYTRSWRV